MDKPCRERFVEHLRQDWNVAKHLGRQIDPIPENESDVPTTIAPNPSNTGKRPANSPMPSRTRTDEFTLIPEQATGSIVDLFTSILHHHHLQGFTLPARGKRMMSEQQRDAAEGVA